MRLSSIVLGGEELVLAAAQRVAQRAANTATALRREYRARKLASYIDETTAFAEKVASLDEAGRVKLAEEQRAIAERAMKLRKRRIHVT